MKLDRTPLLLKTMIFKTGLSGLFLFVLCLSGKVQAQADLQNQQDPKALYDEMLSSPGNYDYSGILTYEQGGQLQTFEIQSVALAGVIDQKLALLNGPETRHHFSFDAFCEKKPSSRSTELGAYYNFYTRGKTRVAGYEGIEIVLLPIDKYRNGYQYVIDSESRLMLRSMTLTPDRRMIERAQFAQLVYTESAIVEEMTQSTTIEAANQAESEAGDKSAVALAKAGSEPHKIGCDQLSIEHGWAAGWLPAGFVILNSKLEGERAVLVYGDGISIFSVFIDTVIESFLPPSNAQRGATTVYINYLSDQSATYLVSIIGEIPMATAERVLSSLRRQ